MLQYGCLTVVRALIDGVDTQLKNCFCIATLILLTLLPEARLIRAIIIPAWLPAQGTNKFLPFSY